MNRSIVLNICVRLLLLAAGAAALVGVVYGAGKLLVPVVDGADKAILAACNPDEYAPGLDEFIRALTDYTNLLIGLSLISWMVAYGLYRLLPKYKTVFTALLAIETVVIGVMAALGKIWPNETYVGANVLEVLWLLAALGTTTYLFHTMDHDAMRRFGRLWWLVLLSVYVTSFVFTDHIKETVARPRPLNDANKPWNEQVRIIPDEVLRGRNSFPSGHTSGTFALLTPIFWYVRNRKVRTGLMTWAVLQAFSRVYTGAHFPFCVLMGGVLGFGVGTLIFFTLWGPSLRAPNDKEPETA